MTCEEQEKVINELNAYIREHCVCDGMGPLDGMSDTGNFEGITSSDIENIKTILRIDNEIHRE